MKIQFSKNSDNEDLRLIKKAKKGNQKSFNKLVLKYQKQIYYAVRKMVIDHDNTADIVQDTFVKAFLNLNQFNDAFPFYPWLHRITVNTALNHQAKKNRNKEVSLNKDEEEYKQIQTKDSNPVEEVIQNELKDKITDALQILPFEQRIVFILKTSEGLSYQEISEQLDISIGTVMSRLSRARAKLKELLRPYLNKETEA